LISVHRHKCSLFNIDDQYLVLKVAKEHMEMVKHGINDFVNTHEWTKGRYKWLGED